MTPANNNQKNKNYIRKFFFFVIAANCDSMKYELVFNFYVYLLFKDISTKVEFLLQFTGEGNNDTLLIWLVVRKCAVQVYFVIAMVMYNISDAKKTFQMQN